MAYNELTRILQAETKFFFGEATTPHTANDFWQWAFSNMDVPFLRGVLIEYLVAKKLIAECDAIVGETVKRLTTYELKEGDLAKSIEKSYEQQPHGDVFDLQLTWGTTVEIKSTGSPANWKLNKTCRWNIIKDRNIDEAVFPAQIYILAEMKSDIAFSEKALNLGDVVFHVRTGEELDALVPADQASIGYSKFVGVGDERRSCGYDELVGVLEQLQARRLREIEKKIRPDWALEGVVSEDQILALAVEKEGGVDAGWHLKLEGEKTSMYVPIRQFESPWREGVTPTWRDWEAAGFSYVPVFKAKEEEAANQ